MFATIKSLIPEPRQGDQPRRYVGRHRQPETARPAVQSAVQPTASAPVSAAPAVVPEGTAA
jgi:hypothetical protein